MKNTILIILIFFIPITGWAQIDTILYKTLGLRGNIKSVTEFTFWAKERNKQVIKSDLCNAASASDKEGWFEIDKSRKTNFKYEYSPSGDMRKKIIYQNVNYPFQTITYSYDRNNKIVKKNLQFILSDAHIYVYSLYEYNNDLLTSIHTYRNGEFLNKELFDYSSDDKLIEHKEVNWEGIVECETFYTYRNGNLIKKENSCSNKDPDKIEIYGYDQLNNQTLFILRYSDGFELIEEKFYDEKGRLIKMESPDYYIIYTYGDKDKLVESNIYSSDGNLSSESAYVYEDGRLISKSIQEGNNKTEYKYTPQGWIESYTIIENNKKNVFLYEYELDSNDNWIRIIEYKNTVPLKMRERTIVYFNN